MTTIISRRRRLLPFAVAAVITCIAGALPTLIGDDLTSVLTNPIVIVMYAFLGVMFYWIRRRLLTNLGRENRFVVILSDFFIAIIALGVMIAAVYGGVLIVYLFFARPHTVNGVTTTETPAIVRAAFRTAVIGVAALIGSTGVPLAYELRGSKETSA